MGRHDSGVRRHQGKAPDGFHHQGPDAPSAHRRPGYPLSGCVPAEPDSVSPGRVRLASTEQCGKPPSDTGVMPQKILLSRCPTEKWPKVTHSLGRRAIILSCLAGRCRRAGGIASRAAVTDPDRARSPPVIERRVYQDRLEPGAELTGGPSFKPGEVAPGVDERVLENVGRCEQAGFVGPPPSPDDQLEVIAARLQRAPPRRRVTARRRGEIRLGCRWTDLDAANS